MTQPAQQPPAGPPQPTTLQGGQQPPPDVPPATPAPAIPAGQEPQQPQGTPVSTPPPPQPVGPPSYGHLPPPQPPQPAASAPGVVPPQPPTPVPYTPATTGDNDGINWDRLPKAAREQIERLQQEATQAQAQARAATVTTQAYTVAAQVGVNPAALVGSVAWQQAAAQLDPADPQFVDLLTSTIQGIAEANPWMVAQSPVPPARSGGNFAGAPATPPPSLEEQIAEAQRKGDWRAVIRLQNQRLANIQQQ